MNQVKITVLKTTLDEELAAQYGAPGLTACPMMEAGQIFYADYAKPEGFCDEAWKAIYQYVFALAHGAGWKGCILFRRLDSSARRCHLFLQRWSASCNFQTGGERSACQTLL